MFLLLLFNCTPSQAHPLPILRPLAYGANFRYLTAISLKLVLVLSALMKIDFTGCMWRKVKQVTFLKNYFTRVFLTCSMVRVLDSLTISSWWCSRPCPCHTAVMPSPPSHFCVNSVLNCVVKIAFYKCQKPFLSTRLRRWAVLCRLDHVDSFRAGDELLYVELATTILVSRGLVR